MDDASYEQAKVWLRANGFGFASGAWRRPQPDERPATTCRVCRKFGQKRRAVSNGLCGPHNMRTRMGIDLNSPIQPLPRRLTADDVKKVRREYLSREAPRIIDLAERYQVGRKTIWAVLHGHRRRVRDGLQEEIDRRCWENVHPHSDRKASRPRAKKGRRRSR
jgi:hypothetical protein